VERKKKPMLPDGTYQELWCWWGDRGDTRASREQETMMVNMTPRQTNLTPRLTPFLLTDHMTPDRFPKRPLSMKGQRWKHIVVEQEKRRKKKV
jgi:hypothetical protein